MRPGITVSVLCLFVPALQAGDDPVSFNRDVLPILSDSCFACHGPDAKARKAKLRLDLEADAFADRDGVPAVVPSKPGESELIVRIFHDDPDEAMPPSDFERQLTGSQKEILKRWVAEGAEWQAHWSFVPPIRPELPVAEDRTWPRNGIDHFVLDRLAREKLEPSPEASKETLIRRMTFDLTGLPPAPEEVRAFLADRSETAYEKVVDRLLKSKHYGEAMALPWLDAARFADTDGYQNDGPRTMWRWRDWVIEAYNAGKPFDVFTIEQLAGDLLPEPDLDQRIATGFNRNHRYNSESGLVLEEFLIENAVDRVDTTATVWMGLTMGCARCHDHKYDPISQREYYQLMAFFDNVPESGRAVKFGNSEPFIKAPTREHQVTLAGHDEKVAAAAAAISAAESEIATAQAEWGKTLRGDGGRDWNAMVASGMAAHFPLEESTKEVKAAKGAPVFRTGMRGNAVAVDGDDQLSVGTAGGGIYNAQSRFSVSFWINPEDAGKGVILSKQKGNTLRPGLAVEMKNGRLRFSVITRWIAGVGAVETEERLKPGEWRQVVLTNDGSQSALGMKIYLDGKPAATRILYNTNSNTGGAPKDAPMRIGGGVHGPDFNGLVDDLRVYNRTLWEDEIAELGEPLFPQQIAARRPAERSDSESGKLRAYFLEHAAPPKLKKLAANFEIARAARLKFIDSLPTTMVMEEMNPPRDTFVRTRGEYHQRGEQVAPAVPEVFPPMEAGYPGNRLGFARWLVSGEHPLTARVTVNRWWQKFFGRGLVKTSEDFGIQGEAPSHPALLDWLATELVRTGWDVKAIQKTIVMSATYRQSSRVTGELQKKDPENRLLARGSRFRLPGHAIRDHALAASGLLVPEIGGPSVSPYQPANLWKEMSNMTYRQSKGPDLYRRSLYTIWKRTVAPPSLAVLDAADRESCWVRTKRTNTPLQALTLLNETAFVESARKLAERILTENPENPVDYGFELVTARKPTAEEIRILSGALDQYRGEYRDAPKEAAKLIAAGSSPLAKSLDPIELAAHTALANVLLNLDESVTRE